MRRHAHSTIAVLACAAALLCPVPVYATRSVAGVPFEDQLSLANQVLVLNGMGVRVKMIVKVYALGLYVPRKASAPELILSQPGAKSVRIVMLRDVSGAHLADALVSGINSNISVAERAALQPRLNELEQGMLGAGDAAKGAQIRLDFLPGIGTRVSMGGRPLCKDIAGEDFYRALLKIWLGEHPSDSDLKSQLLGQD
jgi:hypothetical protein